MPEFGKKEVLLGALQEPNFQLPNVLIFGVNMSAGLRLGAGAGTGTGTVLSV